MQFMQGHCDMVIFSQSRNHSSSRVLNSLELFDDKALRPCKHSIVKSGDYKTVNEGFQSSWCKVPFDAVDFSKLKITYSHNVICLSVHGKHCIPPALDS